MAIVRFFQGLFRGRGPGDGDRGDVAREVVPSRIENRTSFTVEIWRAPVVGAERQRFHILRRGEAIDQETLTGHQW